MKSQIKLSDHFGFGRLMRYMFPYIEKPKLGLFVTLGAGLTNIVFDALLVAVFPFGVVVANR